MHIRNKNDCIMGAGLLLLAILLYHETYSFREVYSFSFGPRVFPRIILGIIGFCSFILILQSITLSGADQKQQKKHTIDTSVLAMRAGMILLLILYIIALPLAGYVPCTSVFLFLTMLLLGVRTRKLIAIYAAISLIVAASLQYIFGTLLKFFLP
ncbi:MAG: tripartite tricarboxylate transporter TctB family protein [Desulfovibrio sp.]|nr:tripartite tricarboxylate transporter TctB family protein [Desulfovibrio sp.]